MYIRFLLSGLGPGTYVSLLLINIHFFKDLRSEWGIFAFLREPYGPSLGSEPLGSSN